MFEGDDTYEAQTVTYTLTVNAEPVPETYTITIAGAGAEYTTTDPADTAAEGDMVTITVDTTNFELGTVEVVGANDTTVETEGSMGEYTFTMPASNVTITVNTR